MEIQAEAVGERISLAAFGEDEQDATLLGKLTIEEAEKLASDLAIAIRTTRLNIVKRILAR